MFHPDSRNSTVGQVSHSGGLLPPVPVRELSGLMASSVDEHPKAKFTEGHFPPNDEEPFNLHCWYGPFVEPLPCPIFAASESILIYRILVDFSSPFCRRYTRKACECCSELEVIRT